MHNLTNYKENAVVHDIPYRVKMANTFHIEQIFFVEGGGWQPTRAFRVYLKKKLRLIFDT